MKFLNHFYHLTLEDRHIILSGITNGSTKTAIAKTIGKNKSTVCKEIKLHRKLTHRCSMPLECNNLHTSKANRLDVYWLNQSKLP
ncbi:helix-turn-helix domain-containing protein [Lachnoanaerobaculum gingivalis]|uniref:helix-turn-helix domain-containing protein n=1 Tax=Lachnoanaerobaculum gingivalis TaxID=2490855 RepID=UPI00242B64AB|nr:helix-turn-helix domain-containing protein [Lachnoanaerobaculum gingivalis]